MGAKKDRTSKVNFTDIVNELSKTKQKHFKLKQSVWLSIVFTTIYSYIKYKLLRSWKILVQRFQWEYTLKISWPCQNGLWFEQWVSNYGPVIEIKRTQVTSVDTSIPKPNINLSVNSLMGF